MPRRPSPSDPLEERRPDLRVLVILFFFLSLLSLSDSESLEDDEDDDELLLLEESDDESESLLEEEDDESLEEEEEEEEDDELPCCALSSASCFSLSAWIRAGSCLRYSRADVVSPPSPIDVKKLIANRRLLAVSRGNRPMYQCAHAGSLRRSFSLTRPRFSARSWKRILMKIREEEVVSSRVILRAWRTSQVMASVPRRWENSLATLRSLPVSSLVCVVCVCGEGRGIGEQRERERRDVDVCVLRSGRGFGTERREGGRERVRRCVWI